MRAASWILISGGLFLAMGCASSHEAEKPWMTSGSITIARPVPQAQDLSAALLGFMPRKGEHVISQNAPNDSGALKASYWLSVDRASKAIALMQGERQVEHFIGEGVQSLSEGRYELAHKQRSALWYAPDSYFLARGETPPKPGDKARFRRGALGEFSLFVTKDIPVHSGPVWTDEIGGVRLTETEIAKLYYSLEPGALIEVR